MQIYQIADAYFPKLLAMHNQQKMPLCHLDALDAKITT